MGSNECIDRINDLSDDILCRILSYLPLKDVVAASVLSTRWKHLFPSSVALVRLDLGDSCKLEIVHKFMNKLLNVTLRDVRCVEKIVFGIKDLCWYLDDAFVLWIGRAFKRLNVQHLQLMLDQCESMAVFESLHGCSTLVELELGSFSNLDLSNEFILPNLKRLSLYEFRLYRDNPIDDKDLKKLLDGCPVLNDLRIINCLFGNLDTFHIQHPKIKKLYLDEGCSDRRVVIDCPDLEVIMFKDRCCVKEDFDLKNTKTLRLACFDFFCYDDGNICELAKLVKACSSTTHLCLSGTLMTSLFHWSVPLPTFQNLTCLAVGHLGLNGWVMLVRLLESAPNLTVLSFEEELGFKWPYMDSSSLVQSSTKSKSLLPCSSRAYTNINSSLPVNLLLNTKKIEIWEFKWKPEEMKLIEYFLKEGKVLQELIVHCFPGENISDLQKLLLLPRYSRACQLLFKDKSNFECNFEKSRYSRENWF